MVDFLIPLIAWLLSCDISDSLHFRPFCRIASQRPTLGWSAISWIWVTTSKRGTWNASATRKSLTRTSSPTTATLPSTFDFLVLWTLWNRCWSYRDALMWLFEISVYPHLFTFSVLPPLYFLSRAFLLFEIHRLWSFSSDLFTWILNIEYQMVNRAHWGWILLVSHLTLSESGDRAARFSFSMRCIKKGNLVTLL